jgi:uncharacterized protein YutE (UPF0331/DUF86 family)
MDPAEGHEAPIGKTVAALFERFWKMQRARAVSLVLWPLVVLIVAVLALRHVTNAKDVADLISATASLLWPIIAFTVITWFRPELRALLARIRKGKFLGQEIELDQMLNNTDEAVVEAEETAAENISVATGTAAATGTAEGTSSAAVQAAPIDDRTEIDAVQNEIEEVLREAARSPRIGLMLLSSKMDRAARDLALAIGLNVGSRGGAPLSLLIRELVQAERITRQDANALGLFNQVRNQIVHGHDADDNEVARAIDSGTRLLRLLLSTPRFPQIGPTAEPTYD